jgi:hypothetical protein
VENIRPLVDGWVAFDDRSSTEMFSNEPARRNLLLDHAARLGARWVLAVDPDERFETGLAGQMPALLAAEGPTAYTFRLRELFASDAYRDDGIWGLKRQVRLFTLGEIPSYNMDIHSPWLPTGSPHKQLTTDVNLYHLKMITPERREARRDLYNHLDPEKRYQKIGYDYLADMRDAVLVKVPRDRGYQPPHRDDGRLWMPDVNGVSGEPGRTEPVTFPAIVRNAARRLLAKLPEAFTRLRCR